MGAAQSAQMAMETLRFPTPRAPIPIGMGLRLGAPWPDPAVPMALMVGNCSLGEGGTASGAGSLSSLYRSPSKALRVITATQRGDNIFPDGCCCLQPALFMSPCYSGGGIVSALQKSAGIVAFLGLFERENCLFQPQPGAGGRWHRGFLDVFCSLLYLWDLLLVWALE